ncbi:MAG: transposase, partial [Hadesarchaea archaeon]|nr:transposase [Hadesarchaea archaeon]
MVQAVKTLKLPVGELTKAKLDVLNRLTARLTYATRLWLEVIGRERTTSRTKIERHRKEIQAQTGLNAAFAQATRDRVLWMWRSYRTLHREWRRRVRKLERFLKRTKDPKLRRKLERKLHRLKQREPSEPTVARKQPVMFDRRMG